MLRNSSKYQTEIDYLRDLVDDREGQPVAGEDFGASGQLERMANSVPLKKRELDTPDIRVQMKDV